MRPHVTGSSVDRFLHCQHWAHPSVALPKVVQTPAMSEGTRRHKIAEYVLRGGRPFPDPQDLALVNAAETLRSVSSVLQVEQGYAYDPATRKVRVIAGRTEEGYEGATAKEIPGTLDAVYRDESGVLVVRDWKLGPRGITYQSDPGTAGQLLFGMHVVRLSGLFSISSMAVEFADDTSVARAPVTHAVLDEFADKLSDAWSAATAETVPAPKPGAHCKWCPLENSCPAPYGIVKQAAEPITDGKFRLPMAIETVRDANDFIAASEFVEAYLERMKEQLKTFARSNVVVKGKQQYREELEARMVSDDIGALGDALSGNVPLPAEAHDLRVIWKHKGEPKPVFRWRAMRGAK